MKVHAQGKIKALKKLRKAGHSINELSALLSIPKTTVWHHVHNIKLTLDQQRRLDAKRGGSASRKAKNIEKAYIHAKSLLLEQDRELLTAVAMLYWAEGSKNVCEFINSDGKMVRIYLKVLEKF